MKKLLALLCSAVALFAFSGCDIEGFFGVDQFEDPKHPAESSSQLPEESSSPEESSGSENPEEPEVPEVPENPEEPEVPEEPEDPEEPEPEPEVPESVVINFNVGSATRVEFAEKGSATLKGYVYGRYSITWDEAITNLVVSYDGQPITNGTIINVVSDIVVTQIGVSTADGAAFTGDIMIEEYVSIPAGPIAIQTGANSVQVDDAFGGVIITYTATDEGFIYFKAVADETNGALGKMGETDTEWVGFPYSMAVEAGQKVTFIVTTANMEADTVDFTLTFSSNYTGNY